MDTFEKILTKLRQDNTDLVDGTIDRYLGLEGDKNINTISLFKAQNDADISSRIIKNVQTALLELGRFNVPVTNDDVQEIKNEATVGAFYWSSQINDIIKSFQIAK